MRNKKEILLIKELRTLLKLTTKLQCYCTLTTHKKKQLNEETTREKRIIFHCILNKCISIFSRITEYKD